MQPDETPKRDSPVGIVPAANPATPWRVSRVEAKPGFCLDVQFMDGTKGEVRLERFLKSAGVVGTVFEPLRDPAFFAQARLHMGVVTWPNGADLAPDAMYDAIRKNPHWTIEP